jgi:four helix bundle protein
MNETKKKYNLEERTMEFSKNVRRFVRTLPKTISNKEDATQLIRSSGSVGANYIEANESLGKKDFLMRIKIARKEAKESTYWLKLINTNQDQTLDKNREILVRESIELMKIFGSIFSKNV